METKKTPGADLEKKKTIFFEIGMVTVLALLFVAFEWSTGNSDIETFSTTKPPIYIDEIPPITRTPEPKAPPIPKIKIVLPAILDIVDNKTETNKNVDFATTEVTEKTPITIIEAPVEPDAVENKIFITVEEMPEFPGGESALRKFIADKVDYPEIAKSNGVSGRVYVQFVVNENGEVIQAKVVRSIDPALDRAALNVINSLPRWKPGKQRDKAVKVSFTVPINFQLAKL